MWRDLVPCLANRYSQSYTRAIPHLYVDSPPLANRWSPFSTAQEALEQQDVPLDDVQLTGYDLARPLPGTHGLLPEY